MVFAFRKGGQEMVKRRLAHVLFCNKTCRMDYQEDWIAVHYEIAFRREDDLSKGRSMKTWLPVTYCPGSNNKQG